MRRHSRGAVDAVQVEVPRPLRMRKEGRRRVVMELVDAVKWMMGTYYEVEEMKGEGRRVGSVQQEFRARL